MQRAGGELFLPGPPLPPVGAQGRQPGGTVAAVEPEPGQGAAHGIDAVGQRQGRRDAEADAQAGGALQTALARAQLPHPDVVRGQMAAVTEAASRDAVGCGRPFRPGLGGQHGRVMGQALAAGLVIVQHAPGAGGLHLEEPDGRGVVHAQVPGRMHGQVGAHRQGTDASRQIGGIQQGGIIGPAHSGGEGTFEFLPVLGLVHAAAGGVQLGLRQVARLRGREAEA